MSLNGREYYVAYRADNGSKGIETFRYNARKFKSPEGQAMTIAKSKSPELSAFKCGTARLTPRVK